MSLCFRVQPPLTVSQLFWHFALFFRNAAISWHEQRQHTCLEILVELHHHVVTISSLILHIFCRCGVCGGILATAFNNPFDVVVSRARNIIDYKAAPYKSVFGCGSFLSFLKAAADTTWLFPRSFEFCGPKALELFFLDFLPR